MARHIAAGVISFMVSLIFQYLFKAFTDWNILWISAVPSWSSYDRTGMLLCMTCIPIIPAVSAFMISSLYYSTGDTPR